METTKIKEINFRNTTFLGSFADTSQVPESDLPLVIIVGKSNVGKSSLLNALTGQKHARVSQTPGKTRLVLVFNVDNAFHLVDLPGYGFARTSRADQEAFSKLTEQFVMKRPADLVLSLLDGRHQPTTLDRHMLAYTKEAGLDVLTVLTKVDKTKRQELNKLRQSLQTTFQLPENRKPLAVSAEKRQGIKELREKIASILGFKAKDTD
ncbi:MAG TPA: ribosome biogenesis GTP-binding protein YsxC [Fastidiosipila sp.]|nr:ribosome biogenesis GTP-binding protein YsxC [Fastidiosipila sp.]